jgi:uncharacterized protein (TIGR00251 family)
MPIEIREHGETVSLRVRVQPRASRDTIAGEWGGALKVRLTAPPVDDRANEALCRLLAERLNVSRAAVRITGGAHSRTKQVEICGVTAAQIHTLAVSAV